MSESNTKARLLFLVQYMLEHTDDDHTVSTDDLIRICEENGFRANRHTISDDIAVMKEAGMDIIDERKGMGKSYHIGARLFELAELKMLVDAVLSSKFITIGKNDLLVKKLAKLTNASNRETLTAKVFSMNRIKSSNPMVFQNMDTICHAIVAGNKVSFHYWDYTPEKEKVLRHDGEVYLVSPYALIWENDRYYLAAFSDKRQKVVTFRVDRMCDVQETSEPMVKDDTFNPSVYSSRTMKMFDGDLEDREVDLLCENRFMQNVLDSFGEETQTSVVDDDYFQATVTVKPSKTFFSWVFQFAGGIRIKGPEDVRAAYIGMVKDVLEKQ